MLGNEPFTFAVLTFHQADFILQHLESIRYQVETWGKGRAIHLIIADDCSKDETIPLARAWAQDHKRLFASIRILTAEKNQGIVQNYLRALHAIDTERFKVLAGDDLYYKNDIFTAAQTGQFVLSPVLYFQGGQVLRGQYKLRHWVFQEFIHHEGRDLKQQLLRRQRVKCCICTPGVFYQRSLADDRVDVLLKEHHWMEDYPLWDHLLAREEVEPVLVCCPLVLYRTSDGISNQAGHEKHRAYLQEHQAYLQKIGSPFARYPLWINPHRYLYYARYFAKGVAYGTFVRALDARVDQFWKTMRQEECAAEDHLHEMCERARCWAAETGRDAR